MPNRFLNVHPSLLPKYRGPAPDIGPILNQDTATGITIIILDALVDHGPILSQEEFKLTGNEYSRDLPDGKAGIGTKLFIRGGEILCKIIPDWLNGKITSKEQDHSQASFTKKLVKTDGQISINDNPKELWAKWRAFKPWPGLYFFDIENKRIKITKCRLENDVFTIEKVIPEGGKEIDY
jgi:methionyl-tRNA formyltransferase